MVKMKTVRKMIILAQIVFLLTLQSTCSNIHSKVNQEEVHLSNSNGSSGTESEESKHIKLQDSTRLSSKHDSFVGFTAWIQSHQTYVTGDVISFQGIMINEGNHYNPDFNRFICPTNGVYYVSVTFLGFSSEDLYLDVQKDSTRILKSANYHTENPANIVSNSGIIRCYAGERMWVEAYGPGSVVGDEYLRHSTFTVMLMHEGDAPSETNQLHNSFIGSSVWKGETQQYSGGTTIEFDKVLYNEGNLYDPQLNQFECPVDGIYYVAINMNKYQHNSHTITVEKSFDSILHSTDFGSYNPSNTLSNSCLVRCSAGEYITMEGAGSGYMSGRPDIPITTFSVMLMQEEGSDNLKHSSFVGFTAWNTFQQDYQTGDTILFEDIIINEGNHYSPGLSTFTCPVHAIYFVAASFKKLSSYHLFAAVVLQDETIFRFRENMIDNPSNTVSNTCLVECLTGEEIKVTAIGDGWIDGGSSRSSTFTVMLMHQL